MDIESYTDKSKHFIEGNLKLPEEFPIEYFEKLYKTGKYNQAEIVLGIMGLLKTVCRVELWHVHLKDSSIFKGKSSFDSAHDHLNSHSSHTLKDSIEYLGVNSRRKFVFQITEKGMKNIKKIFPDIYKYLKKKSKHYESLENKSQSPLSKIQPKSQINNILMKLRNLKIFAEYSKMPFRAYYWSVVKIAYNLKIVIF